jgi:adenosylhomocysteine nucleosidase
MRTLIVIPLADELAVVRRAWAEAGLETTDGAIGRLPAVRAPALGCALIVGGLGKAQSAVQAQHALDAEPGWGAIVCAGAAGALHPAPRVGDVVVASATLEHDIRNNFGPPKLPRFPSDPALVAALRAAGAAGAAFATHVAPIASGDEDVVSVERQAALRERTGAWAVAWEGAGVARAALFSGVPFAELRGITDGADHAAAADFLANLPVAMRNVAALLRAWREPAGGRG